MAGSHDGSLQEWTEQAQHLGSPRPYGPGTFREGGWILIGSYALIFLIAVVLLGRFARPRERSEMGEASRPGGAAREQGNRSEPGRSAPTVEAP